MKSWINMAIILSAWAMYVNSMPAEAQPVAAMDDICEFLTSLSPQGQVFSHFNGVFFGDYKSGKNAGSQGPLAINGSFTGDNDFINQRNQVNCTSKSSLTELFDHHGLILNGPIKSPIKVNGFASIQLMENQLQISTPLPECSIKTATAQFDFDLTRRNALTISRRLSSMLPNWTIDKWGILVNIVPEGVQVQQPYHVFTMPVQCSTQSCQVKNYFACGKSHDCQVPDQTLSDVYAMFLNKAGNWNGPTEEAYPTDRMVVINIPVVEGQTFNIETRNPSAGLNACNTIYNFYTVSKDGKYKEEGNFTLVRSSEKSLNGMVIAPQAHIVDKFTGSFTGQVIAGSYESAVDGLQIQDYESSGNKQCKAFAGCASYVNKILLPSIN